jgi:hypothetical protein
MDEATVPNSLDALLPLVFEGRIKTMDIFNIWRYRGRLLFPRLYRWVISLLLTLLVIAGLWWWSPQWWWMVVLGLLVVWVGFLFLWPSEVYRAAQRHYRKFQTHYRDTRITLGQDQIEVEDKLAQSHFQWDLINLVAATPEGLLFLYRAKEPIVWLPRRLLEGTDLRNQVLDLVASKGVPIRNLR